MKKKILYTVIAVVAIFVIAFTACKVVEYTKVCKLSETKHAEVFANTEVLRSFADLTLDSSEIEEEDIEVLNLLGELKVKKIRNLPKDNIGFAENRYVLPDGQQFQFNILENNQIVINRVVYSVVEGDLNAVDAKLKEMREED